MRLGKIDPNSYSEPEKVLTKHILLDWTVDFTKRTIKGNATYTFIIIEENLSTIILDVRDITIFDVNCICSNTDIAINFYITEYVKDIGSKLILELPNGTAGELTVRIDYETSPDASALQWLTADQTLGKNHPYLFSQCQAIMARSLIPCQDTPAVKFTYDAIVAHPKELVALMSAVRLENKEGITKFEQKIPIPSYLLAIAIGKLVSRQLGPNSNIWSEEGIIEECAEEFVETDTMLKIASDICGPYVWKQYDLLVMPPSFPFGGMENPCLTFVTPTLLAGDKSLADVVAHEIAHSWTGNLVTNSNFEHFWLNEGFTVFVEGKIVGRLKGDKFRDFHALRNLTDLKDTINTQLSDTPELTKLVVDLSNCGPDDAFSSVPYVKGSTFLRYLEDSLGGAQVFEEFFKFYLNNYKYKSIVTDDFKKCLYDYFSQRGNSKALETIDWDKWLYSEGMPPNLPKLDNTLALVSSKLASLWNLKTLSELQSLAELKEPILTHQLIDMLSKLLEENVLNFDEPKINLLESIYNLKMAKNSEIRFRFMRLCIRSRLMSRVDEIITFANSNFRMKFVRPIYRDLGQWPEVKELAIENFQKVKNQMMQVCSYGVAKDLGLE